MTMDAGETPTPVVEPIRHAKIVEALANLALSLNGTANRIAEYAHGVGEGRVPFEAAIIGTELRGARDQLHKAALTVDPEHQDVARYVPALATG